MDTGALGPGWIIIRNRYELFYLQEGSLHAEDIPVARIAGEIGTPLYIYSHATIERHFSCSTGPSRAYPT